MRVSIDFDPGAVPAATVDVTSAASTAAGGGAIDGGQPSTELLEAVAAAGGRAPGSKGLAPTAITRDSGARPIDAGPARG
jgi:hypothetical protein